jgi:hypothetical protein
MVVYVAKRVTPTSVFTTNGGSTFCSEKTTTGVVTVSEKRLLVEYNEEKKLALHSSKSSSSFKERQSQYAIETEVIIPAELTPSRLIIDLINSTSIVLPCSCAILDTAAHVLILTGRKSRTGLLNMNPNDLASAADTLSDGRALLLFLPLACAEEGLVPEDVLLLFLSLLFADWSVGDGVGGPMADAGAATFI